MFSRFESPHRFDTGFIPTADPARGNIAVTRNSPLISGVSENDLGNIGFRAAFMLVVWVATKALFPPSKNHKQ